MDLTKVESLRLILRQELGKNCKKVFEKKDIGLSFIFNRQSINKLGCDKTIKASKQNGFNVYEHFEAAENIKELFEHSELIEKHYLIKNSRTETYWLFYCQITDKVFAYMPVVTKGKDEGYIDLYLSKKGE